jgi:hypothetical protein
MEERKNLSERKKKHEEEGLHILIVRDREGKSVCERGKEKKNNYIKWGWGEGGMSAYGGKSSQFPLFVHAHSSFHHPILTLL